MSCEIDGVHPAATPTPLERGLRAARRLAASGFRRVSEAVERHLTNARVCTLPSPYQVAVRAVMDDPEGVLMAAAEGAIALTGAAAITTAGRRIQQPGRRLVVTGAAVLVVNRVLFYAGECLTARSLERGLRQPLRMRPAGRPERKDAAPDQSGDTIDGGPLTPAADLRMDLGWPPHSGPQIRYPISPAEDDRAADPGTA